MQLIKKHIILLLTLLTLLVCGVFNSTTLASDCTFNVTPNDWTGSGKMFDATFCSVSAQTPNRAIKISYSINLVSTFLGKSLTYDLYAKATDGSETCIKTGLSVGNGGTANHSASFTTNKEIASFSIKQTSDKFGGNRTVNITGITVVYKYAASLTPSDATLGVNNTPVDGSSQVSFSVDYQNSTNSATITAVPQAGASSYFTISPSSSNVSNCSGTLNYTVTFAPKSAVKDATATFTISGNGSSTSVTVTGTSFAIVDPVFTKSAIFKTSYFVGDPNINLRSLWTSNNATGEITYSYIFEESGENNGGAPDNSYIDGNDVLHLGKAGKIVVTMHQEASTGYNEHEETHTIVVNKYDPEFDWRGNPLTYYHKTTINNIFFLTKGNSYNITSDNEASAEVIDNNLHIYNVAEPATITVNHPETYKWNGKTQDYIINPVNPTNHVPFTMNTEASRIALYSGIASNGTISCSTSGVITLTQGGPVWTANPLYYDIHFDGIPDKLSFIYQQGHTTSTAIGATKKAFIVYQSSDGANWSEIWTSDGVKGNENEYSVSNVGLMPTTRYLRFFYDATYDGYYKNITVTELHQFSATPNPLDFGRKGEKYGKQTEKLTFNHANAGRSISMDITGADEQYFKIEYHTIAPGTTGRDLYNTGYICVSFDHKKDKSHGENSYEAYLHIKDNTKPIPNEEIVLLTGKRYGLLDPEYTWNPNRIPYYIDNKNGTETRIAHVATSSNTKSPLKYSSDHPSTVYVDGEGTLVIKPNATEDSVTITISQDGVADEFNAGSASFKFKPRKKPDMKVPFQITESKYKELETGDLCAWDNGNGVRVGVESVTIPLIGVVELGGFVWENEGKSFTIAFDGTPDRLSFKYKCSSNSTTLDPSWEALVEQTKHMWSVSESANGSDWEEVWYDHNKKTDWTSVYDIPLSENTRYLRFTYRGNFRGFFSEINVSELVGYKYLQAENTNGPYLSRGAKWGTQAIVDDLGMTLRLSSFTKDNTNYYTRFRGVDNQQYLHETVTEDANKIHEVFTDDATAGNSSNLWKVEDIDATTFYIKSANDKGAEGQYFTINNDNTLGFTSNQGKATKWLMEDYTQHRTHIDELYREEVAAAAEIDFGEDYNTLDKVLAGLRDQDFIRDTLNNIDPVALSEQKYLAGNPETGRYGEAGTVELYEHSILVTPGFYRLTMNAFCRISNPNIAWACHADGTESVLTYLYANDVSYPIQSLYQTPHGQLNTDDEEHNGVYYPTNITNAEYVINNYTNEIFVYVKDNGTGKGTLAYGVKNPSYVPGAWVVYKDITIEHLSRKRFIFNGGTGNTDEWNNKNGWTNKDTPGEYHDVTIEHDVKISGDSISIYSLTIKDGYQVTIGEGAVLTIGDGSSKETKGAKPGNLHVENGGKVILNGKGELQVCDFILDAKLGGPDIYEKKQAASSGQVQKSENLTIAENAYFKMEFDPKGEISYGWYDFVVPFEVNVENGLFLCNDDGTTTLMVSESDFVIQEYDESKRASNIPSWTNFSGTMQPGRVYTIAFNYKKMPNQNAFLFKKVPPTKGYSEYGTNSFTTSFTKNGNGGNEDKGWNGLGNGTFSHVQIKGATKDTKMQIFNHASNSFTVTRADTLTFAVGTSFFIQVDEEGAKEPIELEPAEATEDKPLLVPAYNGCHVNEFCLALTLEGAENESDRIWVSASEDATGEYVIGRDLLKMGNLTEAKVARIWAKRNNLNLCDAEMPLIGSEANCDLIVFVPQEGTYILGLENGPEDAALYLTYNGKVIWDLTASPASLVLKKGIKEGLGLRIKSNKISEIAEGVDETNADNQTLRKVFIDNIIYVVTPDGAMYDLTGKMIK